MKDSPFIYGTTVSRRAFTNRDEEAARLSSNLVNGINTMLISPRRWGKSSLVEKVALDIRKKEKNIRIVQIDLFSVSNEEEFLELFAREVIKASSAKWQEWIKAGKTFFKQLVPKFSMGFQDTDFSVSFDWKELKKHSQEVLNLPETIAKDKAIRFVICLDEFQNLAGFKGYEDLEKKMRACWQRQHSVTYCLYGSKRHMMTYIFNNPSKPFYRFGDIIMLPKIRREKWKKFILKSFNDSGKQIEPAVAMRIPELMKNHSWYVQQLSHYTWNLTEKKAGATELAAALNELIQANLPLYQKETENISATQLNLLKAIAKGEQKLMSAGVMNSYQLGTPRNVSKNRDILIAADLITEGDNGFEFLDPAFELWFRKTYFNKQIAI